MEQKKRNVKQRSGREATSYEWLENVGASHTVTLIDKEQIRDPTH